MALKLTRWKRRIENPEGRARYPGEPPPRKRLIPGWVNGETARLLTVYRKVNVGSSPTPGANLFVFCLMSNPLV